MDDALSADRLRGIPSLTGVPPRLDDDLPLEPVPLFARWLDQAIEWEVPEPLAMTLATVDRDGVPDARTVILKAVDHRGWAFAGPRSSRKADQLADRPAAALNLWWQPLMRAVRVRGMVEEASREDSDADLAARSAAARADVLPGGWVLWRVRPSRVEFWQGAADRRHHRIVYTRHGDRWDLTTSTGEAGAAGPDRGGAR